MPPEDSDYAMRWRLIKRDFTRALLQRGVLDRRAAARRGRDERSLWQRRYWEHQIRNDADYERHVDYIHLNPVKHGHVLRAADWRYSSFHRFVRMGILQPDWGVSAAVRFDGGYGEAPDR